MVKQRYIKKNRFQRPVLSIPGSNYENLNRILALFFGKISGASIDTNRQGARKDLELISLENNKQIVSHEIKFVRQRAICRGYRNFSNRTLIKQPSSRNPKVCNEKSVKASDGKCSF